MTNRFWTLTLALLLSAGTAGFAQEDGVALSADTLEYDAEGQVLLTGNVNIKHQGAVLTCDTAKYNRDSGQMLATGNVVLRKDDKTLTSDRMVYNSKTEQAGAAGNVVFNDATREWTGPKLSYNFRTETGDFGDLKVYYEPFHIISPVTKKVDAGHFVAEDAIITTCEPDDKEFYITAKRADIYSERIIRAEKVKFYLNDIPVMYLPSYTVDLDREHTNFDILPGYGSRPGAFLLLGYSWYLNDDFYTTTHLDIRSKRGIGVGQDLRWRDSENELWQGLVTAYFSNDDEPYKSIEQEERERGRGINIDEERYRIRASHTQSLSDNENVFVEMNFMSDPEVTKDFFDDEFRLSPDPENRISYIYTDRHFQAGLEVKKELNDEDFSSLNRIPEASFDVSRLRIADTPFFYESENAAAFLEQTFSDFDTTTLGAIDSESLRLHSDHTIFFPKRYMGFLNVIPRFGATGTYYGDTPGQATVSSNLVQVVDADGISSLSTNVVNGFTGGSAEFRGMVELGMETSFKAFKVLDANGPTIFGWGRGTRHVVEPFVDYSYVPEPNLRPGELFQFDEIDQLDQRNDVTFGIRNKWQTRMDVHGYEQEYSQLIDLFDAQVSTTYDLDPEPFQDELGQINFDVEIRPAYSFVIDFVLSYDQNEGELSFATTQLQYWMADGGTIALDHFYITDQNNVAQLEYDLWPESTIGLEGYTRYEIDDGELEEQLLLLTYKTDCVGYGLGFRWIAGDADPDISGTDDDDFRVWAQLWLLAFPKSILEMGGN